jgi:hypothetical protein
MSKEQSTMPRIRMTVPRNLIEVHDGIGGFHRDGDTPDLPYPQAKDLVDRKLAVWLGPWLEREVLHFGKWRRSLVTALWGTAQAS